MARVIMIEILCLPHPLQPQQIQAPYVLAKTLAFHLYLNLAIPGFSQVSCPRLWKLFIFTAFHCHLIL